MDISFKEAVYYGLLYGFPGVCLGFIFLCHFIFRLSYKIITGRECEKIRRRLLILLSGLLCGLIILFFSFLK